MSVVSATVISVGVDTTPPPYSYQYVPFLIRIVGTVVDRSLFASANNLISPLLDGLEVFTNVTDPLVMI